MPFYRAIGQIPSKRHVQFRRPDGGLYYEEVMGTEGFAGPTSTLYHRHPPTQVAGWEPMYSTTTELVETEVMRVRHLETPKMTPKGDPITGRTVLLGNGDCEIAICMPAQSMDYHYKNGTGDELLFIHEGHGHIDSVFGHLEMRRHDYVVIPKGTIYRMKFDEPEPGAPQPKFLVIEMVNGSHIQPPRTYLAKKTAQFLEHAPFCERDLRVPEGPLFIEELGEHEVRIKARGQVHRYLYNYHPLDVVGWDGCLYPYCFNASDFAPIVGTLHMPPPIHQTFEAHNMVICTFAPRKLDFHPNAVKVPYYHSNLDSDEVLYYVEGNYKARKGIDVGSITLHPQGIPHGPHPGTIEATLDLEWTDELAVMCDPFRPLHPTKAALAIDDAGYPASWKAAEIAAVKS